MHHLITKDTCLLTLAEPYDYLSAGEEYLATPRGSYVRVDRVDESSGTFLRLWQWDRLLDGAAGASITPHPERP
ncbi:hypothetical protein [Novosphingobium meiothermophilum]|uniref:hypothetical protein n=1 Tax=Novosphingobium meiothermophilum TaxID=2202251 RepID=UPI000D6E00B4|nr:hypothetical protein [Novosphingobium meiothermophilum]